MATEKVRINRAPVLTLWAAIVAERLGFDADEALTLGKAVAGLNAQAKGQRLGIFTPGKERSERVRQRPSGEQYLVSLLGRPVPATTTPAGVRATIKGEPIRPESVRRYLEGKFGDSLADVREAMEELARSFSPEDLADQAFRLYEHFRPAIPVGVQGWGAEGDLDLARIRSLAPPLKSAGNARPGPAVHEWP